MTPHLLRHFFNVWRPGTRNYAGPHFGGSRFAMRGPFWMILTRRALGEDFVVWDKAGEIEFVKPGRGTVRCRFDLTDAVLNELRAEAAGGGKVLRWMDCPVVDAEGDVVARVRKQIYVRLKPRVRREAAAERDGAHSPRGSTAPRP